MKLKSLILANWRWKVLSLAAATVLWMAVASEPDIATILRVPVQFRSTPKDLEISSDIVSNIRLELSGASGLLREYDNKPDPVVLDFSSVRSAGERTFNIDSSAVHLPRGVRLISAVPGELRFVFENREQRAVPVQIEWTGRLPGEQHIARVDIEPPNLVVVGPASRVNLVQSVTTDPIDLSTIRSGQFVMTSPYVKETFVRFLHFENVRVRVILSS